MTNREPVTRRELVRGILGWVVTVTFVIAIVHIVVAQRQPTVPASQPPAFPQTVLVPLFPWLMLVGFACEAVRQWRRAAVKRSPLPVGPVEMDLSDDGITVTHAGVRTQFGWGALHSAVETGGQFIIRRSGTPSLLALPKRAITGGPAEASAVRELLSVRVRPPVGAFPVVPIAVAPGGLA